MAEEFLHIIPAMRPAAEQRLEVPPPPPAEPAQPPPALTAEQLQARDAVFADSREPSPLAALVAVWGGTMLVGDLAQEHLKPPEEPPPPRPRLEPPEE